ncbi:hypothetical protein JCM31598_15330 [Desulfonatronum parangueonense]
MVKDDVEYVVCTVEDITERRCAEEELRSKTVPLEAVLHDAPDISALSVLT